MTALRLRLSALFLILGATLLLSCGGDAQGELQTGTDFAIAAATTQFKVAPGATAYTPLDFTWVGCPPKEVTLGLEGAPAGITPTFSNNPALSTSRLSLEIAKTLPPGTYPLLVRASSQGLVHTKSLTVTVDANAPSFSVAITPPTLALDASRPATATVEITRTGGYSGPIDVTVDAPAGFTATVSAASLQGFAASESRTVSIACGSVPSGPYTLQILVSAPNFQVRQALPLTVVDVPTITSFTATPGTIELGASATLNATFRGGTGVIASVGAVTSGSGLSVSPTATTTYTLAVTNSIGTVVTASTTLVVGPVVVVVSPASLTVMAGDPVALTATVTGAVNKGVTWTAPDGGLVASSGSTATWTSPLVPGTFRVVATSLADPTKKATATITVLPLAQISAPTYVTASLGGWVASVPAQTGVTYTWVVSNGFITTGAGTPSITFTAGASGSVGLQVTLANATGSGVATAASIIVPAPGITSFSVAPNATTNPISALLYGEPLRFDAVFSGSATGTGTIDQGIGAITSGTSLTGAGILAKPSGNTTYTLTVTNLAGTAVSTLFGGGPAAVTTTVQPVTVTLGAPAKPSFFITASDGIPPNTEGTCLKATVTGAYDSSYTATVSSASGGFINFTDVFDCGGFGYMVGTTPGAYTLKAISNANPAVFDATVANVVAAPVISSFPYPTLTAPSVYETTPVFTGAVTVDLYNYADPNAPVLLASNFASGTAVNVGASAAAAYKLVATNAAGTSVVAYASSLTLSTTKPLTLDMAGTTATTSPVDPTNPGVNPSPAEHIITSSNPTDLIDWSVTESTGGYISSSPAPTNVGGTSTAIYVPPSIPGTFHVVGTSRSDPTKSITFTRKVYPLFIWPGNQTVGQGYKLHLNAALLGSATSGVTWTLAGAALGSVDANGIYTAPNGGASPITGTETLVAKGLGGTIAASTTLTINSNTAMRGTFNSAFGPPGWIRYHTLTALANGDALLAGGEDSNAPASPVVYYYAQASNTFTALPFVPMSSIRKWGTATLLHDGSVLLAGGQDGSGTALNTAERFYPSGGSGYFQTAGNLTTPRYFHTATLLPNGKVLLAGGKNGSGALASTEVYDPVTDTFTAGPSLRTPRTFHAATRLVDGRVLISGGSTDGAFAGPSATKQADLYTANSGAGTMAATGDIADAAPTFLGIMLHTQDLVPNAAGDVMLIGGNWADAGTFLPSNYVYRYTPGTGTWAKEGQLTVLGHSAPMGMMLPDQSYAIWGGSGITLMEFFLPASGTLDASTVLPLAAPYINGDEGRMVYLQNGKLLVAGKPGAASSAFSAYTYPN